MIEHLVIILVLVLSSLTQGYFGSTKFGQKLDNLLISNAAVAGLKFGA
jgi:hypothetical protein